MTLSKRRLRDMPLFKITSQKANKILPAKVAKERQIHSLFEANLEELLGIYFLAHEYSTSAGGRIDTLGVDKNGSPCIIEYKKGQNDNVINQGLSYLRWLLDHKADFEMLCQNKNVKLSIDWSSPRVICIAESYNKFDIDTVEILPIKIELLKYGLYDGGLLQLEHEKHDNIKVSASEIYKNSKKEKIVSEKLQKEYSIDGLLQGKKEEIKKLFFVMREWITGLDAEVVEEPKKLYMAYKLATNFVDVQIRSNDLKLFLNVPKGKLNDPLRLTRDISKIGHWGNGDYEVKITAKSHLEPVFELVRQSYEFNK